MEILKAEYKHVVSHNKKLYTRVAVSHNEVGYENQWFDSEDRVISRTSPQYKKLNSLFDKLK